MIGEKLIFFTAVQLLTISSSITNPVTAAGKVVDVVLEAWAIFVVTAVAGSWSVLRRKTFGSLTPSSGLT